MTTVSARDMRDEPADRRGACGRTVLALAALLIAGMVGGVAGSPPATAGGPSTAASAAVPATPPAVPSAIPAAGSGTGTVSFGIRTANAKNVDDRGVWEYLDQPPGRSFIDYLGVVNISPQPVTLDVYSADGYNNVDGGVDVLTADKKSTGLGSWIKVGKSKVTVPGRSTVLMPFLVKIPPNAEPGDHMAGIVASFTSTSKDAKGNAIKLNSRTGQRVYVRVRGPLKPEVTVEGLSATYRQGNPVGSGTSSVQFTVRNTGNVRVSGAPNVRVDGLVTNVKVEGIKELPELLPGSAVTLSGTAKGLFPLDRDQVKVQVDPKSAVSAADPKLAPISAAVSFWAVSWLWATLLGIVVAVSIAVAVRRRRRARWNDPGDGAGGGAVAPWGVGGAGEAQPGDRAVAVTERRRLTRRLAWLATAAAALASTLAGLTVPAHAADDGTLTFIPAKGDLSTQFYVVTSAPCPVKAVGFVGFIEGGAFPVSTVSISLNTSGAIDYTKPFGTPLSNTMQLLAQNNGVQLSPGDYTIKMQCTDLDTVNVYRTFTGKLTVGADQKVTGRAPEDPPASGVPLPILSLNFPEVQASLAAEASGTAADGGVATGDDPAAAGQPGTSGAGPGTGQAGAGTGQGGAAGQPGAGASGQAGGPAGPVLGGPNETQEATGPLDTTGTSAEADDGDPLFVFIGLGVLVIASLVGLRWFAARRGAAPASGHQPVDWSAVDVAEVELDDDSVTSPPGAGGPERRE